MFDCYNGRGAGPPDPSESGDSGRAVAGSEKQVGPPASGFLSFFSPFLFLSSLSLVCFQNHFTKCFDDLRDDGVP